MSIFKRREAEGLSATNIEQSTTGSLSADDIGSASRLIATVLKHSHGANGLGLEDAHNHYMADYGPDVAKGQFMTDLHAAGSLKMLIILDGEIRPWNLTEDVDCE